MAHLSPFEVIRLYPQHDFTMHGLFETRTRGNPGRPYIIHKDRTWSWGQFNDAIAATGRMLMGKGITKGDRVAIMATNSDAHPLIFFGLARIGAIMVPVNPEFGVAEAKYVLEHAGVSGILCSADTLEVAKEAAANIKPAPWFMGVEPEAGLPVLHDLIKDPGNAPLPDVSPDDTCAIIYSSGTTGFPKGVMHSQRNFVLSGERHVARVHLQPDDRALCILPMFHINALFYSVAGTAAAGACLIIEPRFSASTFWKRAAESGATLVNVIMAVSTILARRPRSEFVEHKMRLVTGAPFTKEAMDTFKNEFKIPLVIEGFGMTEIPGSFSNPYEGPHKLASMGKLGLHPDPDVTWTQARILDDDGNDVPNGTSGELAIKVPTLMQGYFKDPEQTKAAFKDGWFLTGDLVRREDDGYFWFVARKKDIIRRRGENIAGAELDRIINEHPAVSESAAIAVDSELGEDEIMTVVVAKPDAKVTGEEIRAWCAERLAAHKVPRFVVFADKLPHTPTHKIAKHILKKDAALRARAQDFAPPKSR